MHFATLNLLCCVNICRRLNPDTIPVDIPSRSFLVHVWLRRIHLRIQVLRSAFRFVPKTSHIVALHILRDRRLEGLVLSQGSSWSLAPSPRCSQYQRYLGRLAVEATLRPSTSSRCCLDFARCTCLPFVIVPSECELRLLVERQQRRRLPSGS